MIYVRCAKLAWTPVLIAAATLAWLPMARAEGAAAEPAAAATDDDGDEAKKDAAERWKNRATKAASDGRVIAAGETVSDPVEQTGGNIVIEGKLGGGLTLKDATAFVLGEVDGAIEGDNSHVFVLGNVNGPITLKGGMGLKVAGTVNGDISLQGTDLKKTPEATITGTVTKE